MPRVAIIDYGIGNLFSITNALKKIGLDAKVYSSTESLKNVDAIVLPGVGNFRAGSRNLQLLKSYIAEMIEAGTPVFGICLGMQLLFQDSEEGDGSGLGFLRGRVLRLPSCVKIPHMGWNTIRISRPNDLLDGIYDGSYFYFVHSYYANCVDSEIIVAETDYGTNFASVIAKGNIYGTQFHPEKSGRSGERIIRNFAEIVKK